MLSQEKKKKSLFSLFQKQALEETNVLNSDGKDEDTASAAPSAEPPAADTATKDEKPAAYQYTASWQKAADNEQDEQEKEVLVNAHGVASRLQEILAEQDTPTAEEPQEPRCVSNHAAEKFTQALYCHENKPAESTAEQPNAAIEIQAAVQAVVQAESRPRARFSERLKQHVENALPPANAATREHEHQ